MFQSICSGRDRRFLQTVVLVFCLSLSSSQLRADFVFHVGPGAIQPAENLEFNHPGLISLGNMVQGRTNHSHTIFEITSNDNPQKVLTTPSNGQARVEAVDNEYRSIFIEAQDSNIYFSDLEFNVNILNQTSGTFELTVIDQYGNVFLDDFSTDTLGSGQNFFSVEGTNGMLMQRAILTASSDIIQDVRQIRISVPTAIPEPAAMVWFGVATLLGAALRRRPVAR